MLTNYKWWISLAMMEFVELRRVIFLLFIEGTLTEPINQCAPTHSNHTKCMNCMSFWRVTITTHPDTALWRHSSFIMLRLKWLSKSMTLYVLHLIQSVIILFWDTCSKWSLGFYWIHIFLLNKLTLNLLRIFSTEEIQKH